MQPSHPGFPFATEPFRISPLPAFAFPIVPGSHHAKVPRLMAACLVVGARICGEPALDREFKTIDFLTFLDLDALPAVAVARKYLG